MNYRDSDKALAYQRVAELKELIENKLFDEGYMFYDEFKVSVGVARYIPYILNDKYPSDNEEYVFATLEEIVGESGLEGLIYNTEIIDDRSFLSRVLHAYYKNKMKQW